MCYHLRQKWMGSPPGRCCRGDGLLGPLSPVSRRPPSFQEAGILWAPERDFVSQQVRQISLFLLSTPRRHENLWQPLSRGVTCPGLLLSRYARSGQAATEGSREQSAARKRGKRQLRCRTAVALTALECHALDRDVRDPTFPALQGCDMLHKRTDLHIDFHGAAPEPNIELRFRVWEAQNIPCAFAKAVGLSFENAFQLRTRRTASVVHSRIKLELNLLDDLYHQ